MLGVHHAGKDGKTFRGSSVFEAGADTVYSVTLDGAVISLTVRSERDGPLLDGHRLKIDPMPGTASATIGNLSTGSGQIRIGRPVFCPLLSSTSPTPARAKLSFGPSRR